MNPGTFNWTDGNTTNFTKYEGVNGTGDGDYLLTGYIPNTHKINIAQNSITLAVYALEDKVETTAAIGCEGGTNRLYLRPCNVSTQQSSILNSGGAMTVNTGSGEGFHMATRRGAAETEAYRNGASLGGDTDASTGVPADDQIYILAYNNDGVAEAFYSGKISIIIVMAAVSDTDASNINTIIETYMDAIGKGVE
jgi:hypothetical protein